MQAVARWGIPHIVFFRNHVTEEGAEDGGDFRPRKCTEALVNEWLNPPGLRDGLKSLVRYCYRDVKPRVRGAQRCKY